MMNTTENNNNINNNNNGQLQVFQNEAFGQVRVITKDGEPWFVGKDVAEILGYKKLDALYRIIEDEDKQKIDPQNRTMTGFPQNGVLEPNPNIRTMLLINESGLYQAIFNSTLPAARQFKRWVTSEVLPTIRKHKMYLTPETAQEAVEDPGVFLAKAMLVANDVIEQQKTKIIEQRQEILKLAPKAKKYDKYMKAEDSYTISDVAIMNGLAPDKFFNYLKSLGWLRKPYRGAHELTEEAPTGYFKVIRTYFNGCVRGTQIRVTVEGYRNISNLLSAIKLCKPVENYTRK
jgi:prophage antirepressor-like protein